MNRILARLLPLLAAAPALAQITPIHTAPDDPAGGAYGIWAAGDDYKVGFANDMTFVPYLGREYPVTRSLQWRTLAASVAGHSLLDDGEQPRRWHDEDRYEYRYSRLVEAYDVRPEGVEQTFVLNEAIGLHGDFTVRGQLTANVNGTLQRDGSIAFADDHGDVVIDYGRATVIDAAGRSLALTTRFVDGVVEWTVPASWMADASYPVTIDPLIASVTLTTGVAPAESVNMTRSDEHDVLLVTHTRFTSATDADAWAIRHADDWGNVTPVQVFTDLSNNWSTPTIDCATCGPRGKWVVAMARELLAGGSAIRVWSQPTDSTLLINSVVFAPWVSSRTDWRPAVGGIAYEAEDDVPYDGSHALITYQVDNTSTPSNTATSEVWAMRVDCSNTPVTLDAAQQVSGNIPSLDSEMPSVNKCSAGGTEVEWMIAYQEYDASLASTQWRIKARRFNRFGALDAPTATVNLLTSSWHFMNPLVSGQKGRYTMFYATYPQPFPYTKVSGYLGTMASATRFDWLAGGAITVEAGWTIALPTADRSVRVLGLAYDRDTDSFWDALWKLETATGSSFSASRLGFNGQRCRSDAVYPAAGAGLHGGAIVYNDDAHHFPLCHGVADAGANNPLVGNIHSLPDLSFPSTQGPACHTAELRWTAFDQELREQPTHAQVIGNQGATLIAFGAQPTAFHIVQASLQTSSGVVVHPLVLPNCHLLVDMFGSGYLGSLTGFGSEVRWNLPLIATLPDVTMHFQDWIYDLATDKLTSGKRLSVPISKN